MKKLMRRLLAVVAAMTMVLGFAIPTMAATVTNPEGTDGSITITPPSGTQSTVTTKYEIYKVFDAVSSESGISYKVMATKADKELPDGFVTDAAGNVHHGTKAEDGTVTDSDATELTSDEISAIAAYVKGDTPVKTVTATGEGAVTADKLDDGYYYVTTTTGSLVTIDSSRQGGKNVTIADKNTVPTVDKKVTGTTSYNDESKAAIAQVGTDVSFEATVTFGKGTKNVKFHDDMSEGLSYNNDANISFSDGKYTYTILQTPEPGDDLTIKFQDGIPENVTATITYSAKVTSDALIEDPAKNKASISYGDNNSKTNDSEVKVYNAKFTVTKHDGNGKALAGAGFVIKNASGKYYKYTAATDSASAKVEWVDSINDATEYTSNTDGSVNAFTGLANGSYTLVEKTVPAGYNKAEDYSFTVKAASENGATETVNLAQSTTIVNKAGSELPSTGGMGTTIFYVLGAALVIGAGVVLVTRRRLSK